MRKKIFIYLILASSMRTLHIAFFTKQKLQYESHKKYSNTLHGLYFSFRKLLEMEMIIMDFFCGLVPMGAMSVSKWKSVPTGATHYIF